MSGHDHGHAPIHLHPHNATDPGRDTLLCASAGQRLLIAAAALSALWLSIWWALR